ncbi:MAG: YihY/virulence factor BrkB family protein [Mycoplasma sp.]|nr:YihY/virulence factor BrkB family protein [Mycoplasma sp.]
MFNKLKNKDKVKAYMSEVVLVKRRTIPLDERIVKFFIWIALRVSIRPVHWKNERKNRNIIHKAYKRITSKDFVFIPPAFAFYLIMAFVPTLIIALYLISFSENVTSYVQDHFLKDIKIDSSNLVLFSSSLTQTISSITLILISAWIASAGFSKFIFTLSHVYGHEKFGGFWMNRIKGMTIVLAFSLFVAIGMLGWALLPLFLNAIGLTTNSTTYNVLFWVFLTLAGFVYLYGGFVLLFILAPRFKMKWRHVHPGSVAVTIPTLAFILLFGVITRYTLKYSAFGIIAPFMTMAMSMLFVSYFIYVGMVVNVVFYNTHYNGKTIPKKTFSKK